MLIAEDDPVFRDALVELIDSDDHLEIVAVADGPEQAIRMAAELRPDVALVDVKMGQGGGPQAVREIARCSPDTRTLALSAYEDRTSVFRMLRAGAVGYLGKDQPPEEILGAIQRSSVGQGVLAGDVTADVILGLSERLQNEARHSSAVRSKRERILRTIDLGRLTVEFQPIFDTRDGAVLGVEALARFAGQPPHPPTEWFGVAEEVGLRLDLELAAARTALGHLARIPRPVFLSVNVSPATLASPRFATLLRGVPGDRVVVELAEHDRVADPGRVEPALAAIRGHGPRLAIDDVGSGFSCIGHILQLNPDFIKLDAFVTRGLDRDPRRRAIAAALNTVATELGADLVAEGVESAEELSALRELGVRAAQGWHLAAPAPLAELACLRERLIAAPTPAARPAGGN